MKRRKGSSIFLFLIRCEALTPRPAITRSIINLIMHQISQRAPTLTNEWFLVLCDPFDLNCRLDSFLIIILIQLLHIPSHLFEQLELIGMKELRTNCTGWVIDVGHQLNRLSPFFHFTLNFFFLLASRCCSCWLVLLPILFYSFCLALVSFFVLFIGAAGRFFVSWWPSTGRWCRGKDQTCSALHFSPTKHSGSFILSFLPWDGIKSWWILLACVFF